MTEISTNILENASKCFTNARKNLLAGAAMLHEISAKKLWEGSFSSFNEYVEQSCQIKPSFASKLISVYSFWIVEKGFSQAKLMGIDTERLYLARKLGGTPEDILQKALVLTRDELKDELRDEKSGPHECELGEERWGKCKICDKFHRV